MAYGSDITEGLPYVLSNPVGVVSYSPNAESYDVSINGLPFFLATGDTYPYRRQTAQYRKQQIDQSSEPGEQSITGWWVRAQSSFHKGSGIKFYDPSAGEVVAHRFADSKGVNIWEKGKVTLLKNVTAGHITTGPIASNGNVQQHIRSIKWSTFTGALLHDGYDVDKIKITDPSNPIHFIDYNSGADSPVYGICDDGVTAYWITNTSTKKTVYKKALTLTSSDADTKMFDEIGTISNATMEYVKDRIILCADNKVYEFSTSASSIPSPVYTQAATTHVYTSITASGPAIYIAGYNGSQSTIQKFTLSTAGAMPTLTSAIVAAELPVGEIVHKIYYYLGYMMIGTNRGVRAATVSDQDGSISYGPLIVETSQPCYDFAARDKYVWCATSVAGEPGLIRIDLGNEIESLRFAYANDIYYPGVTGHVTTACCFDGNTDSTAIPRMMFATAYASSANGAVYVEDASTLVSSGYVTTGKIRYSTLENKVFKNLKSRIDNTNGGLQISSIDMAGQAYSIGSFTEGDFTPEVGIPYPVGAQEYMSFKFTISRSTLDSTKGPIFNGYQLKSLPAIPRQRLITYPVSLFDRELDSFGVEVGHEGSAYDRIQDLEIVESNGDTIRIDDFRTGESYLGIIEEIQFINTTPSDKRYSGFGGIMNVTVRTI
jgi:hypothetical protein